jgi:chemotaxis protein CheY-P-specific phosphatase CheC
MIQFNMALAPQLDERQTARLKELLNGQDEITADYSNLSEEAALEIITLLEGVSLEEAREMLEQSRQGIYEDTVIESPLAN